MSSCEAVVSLLYRIEKAGTTPYDLAGKVWGSWAKELSGHLEVGDQELLDKGVRACWECGLLGVEGDGWQCKECGSRSSIKIETASKEGAVRPMGSKLVDDSLRGLGHRRESPEDADRLYLLPGGTEVEEEVERGDLGVSSFDDQVDDAGATDLK